MDNRIKQLNQVKLPGGIIVTRSRMIGTNLVGYKVYLIEDRPFAKGSTSRCIDEVWYTELGTVYLPTEIAKLPSNSLERYTAVQGFKQRTYNLCYQMISQAYPEVEGKEDYRSMGEILIQDQLIADVVDEVSGYAQYKRDHGIDNILALIRKG